MVRYCHLFQNSSQKIKAKCYIQYLSEKCGIHCECHVCLGINTLCMKVQKPRNSHIRLGDETVSLEGDWDVSLDFLFLLRTVKT